MADFLKAYEKTSQSEGGYTAHPKDNGNWTGGRQGVGVLIGTNFGVSAPLLKQFLGRNPTVTEMKNLSLDTVKNLFKKLYWDAIRGDEIINQEIANEFFDDAILSGQVSAIKKMQTVLGLSVTGKMDKQTLDKINNK
jgi:lysozyme family protein